ncbi:hypothetical protein CKM354_000637600 [Cercospora kikuchii]|uniref:F-box domain-containing protein n=1 Tax=Cercospora kikuchii TaxID=84275 RepID=A0A9P3CH58_9PEZI|nr:uncharacterized protein CKM354_000637600 [Cercospora kikuchii]GIZ43137.1 hypothetical protein CKM354_000637600 [Cercospora kikuchii]
MASYFEVVWRECTDRPLSKRHNLEFDIADVQQIQQQQQALEDGLSKSLTLLNTIPGTEAATQQIRVELETLRANALAIRRPVDQMWDLVPVLMRPTSGAAAEKVFGTPELLEEILTFLPTRMKLDCMGVQRRWYEAVMGSVRLKRMLGLELYTDDFYHSPFDHHLHSERGWDPDYPFMCSWDPWANYSLFGDWGCPALDHAGCSGGPELRDEIENVQLRGTFHSGSKKKTFGSRVGDMRISHPPIPSVHVSVCCHDGWENCCDHPHNETMETEAPSPEGFTVRSLYDAVQDLMEVHAACRCTFRPDSSAATRIGVSAVFHMREDDPLLEERRKRKAKLDLELAEEEREREERRMQATLEFESAIQQEGENSGEPGWTSTVSDSYATSSHGSDSDYDENSMNETQLDDELEQIADADDADDGDDAESWGGEIAHTETDVSSQDQGEGW